MKVPLNTYCSVENMERLNDYIEITGESKADVVDKALSEFFKKVPAKRKPPQVSISDKFLHLDKYAIELLATERAEISFNPEKLVLKIQAVDQGGYKLAKDNRIFCEALVKKYSIPNRGRFEAQYKPEERALYVQL